jgi:acyl-CoA synthetase (AMP-forming)/AMP-acid ligase II
MHKFPSEVWGDDLAEKLPSPVEQFHDSISKYPDNIALVCTHQDADLYGISGSLDVVSGAKSAPYLRWTFKDLKKGVNRLKGALASLGVQKGTPVVTLLPNCAEFTLTWWAAMELGAVVASLDPRRLSNSSEVAHMLETIIAATNYQRPIIVALNEGYLNTPAILSSVSSPAAILVSTEGASQSYSSFKDIMDQSQRPSGIIDEQFNPNQLSETDCSCILFTSGSTSLPKGVLRSRDHQASFAKDVYKTPGYETLPGDIWCSVTPTNHCVGINGMISPMLVGAGVLFPGESFSAEATAHALIHEKCTHMLLVPTMVSMIADYLTEDTKMRGRTNLKAVMLTGSPPTSENLHTCFDVLGSRGVCIRYGSTEGFACVTEIAANGQELVGEGGRLSVGRPIAGNGVKICRPNEKAQLGLPLPRGTTGEIHCSARWGKRTMYIGKEDTDETCYTDEKGKRWLVTGDQGVMDEQGNLYVTGRLKDMIIRGGENISPAAIEARLAKNPRLGSKPIQIVGQPNPISGEVPIAIIADDPEFKSIVSEIYDTVRDEMGLMWVPHEVISLEQLGLGDWPRTSMGKIHRFTLRELVQKRYQDSLDKQTRKEAAREEVCQTDLTWDEDRVKEEILSIWSSSVGLDQNSLRRDLPISQFADSLSLAQVRGHLRRTIPGLKKLRMLDVSGQDTLSKQIEIITERWRGGTIPDDQEVEAETEGPKGPDDMVSPFRLYLQLEDL